LNENVLTILPILVHGGIIFEHHVERYIVHMIGLLSYFMTLHDMTRFDMTGKKEYPQAERINKLS